MPVASGGTTAIDMNDPFGWALLLGSSNSGATSSTTFTTQNGAATYQFVGTGFSNYQGGLPSNGTITSLTYRVNGVVMFTVSGLSYPITTFYYYTNSGFMSDFNASLFAGADTITGTAVDDYLSGHAGNDTINGGDGADTIDVGSGVDTADGGAGVDTISVFRDSSTAAMIISNAAIASAGGATLSDGTLIRNFERFSITSGSGADRLTLDSTLAGNNYFNANTGVDRLVFDASSMTGPFLMSQNGSEITAAINGVFYIQLLNFEEFHVTTGASDDQLVGGAGADIISGGAGHDSIYGNEGNDTLNGNEGNDLLNDGDGNDTLTGGDGADRLVGGAGNNSLLGGDGDDTVIVGSNIQTGVVLGVDVVDGGVGYDFVEIHNFTSTVGVSYNLADFATQTGVTLANGTVIRNFERVIYQAGLGNDTFVINTLAGQSFFDGGGGSDVLIANLSAMTTAIYASNSSISSGTDVFQYYAERVQITGGSQADQLTGSGENDVLNGGGGGDTLRGEWGDDTLNGGEGNDLLYGGPGVNTIDGGAGADWAELDYISSNANLVINLAGMETDTGSTMIDGSSVRNVESFWLRTGNGNDTLYLSGAMVGYNSWSGQSGTDTLIADMSMLSVNVTLYQFNLTVQGGGQLSCHTVDSVQITTGSGRDYLIAAYLNGPHIIRSGAGADIISGADVDDILNGGTGNDEIYGNWGIDIAEFNVTASEASWTLNAQTHWYTVNAGADGVDTITGVEVFRFTDHDIYLDRPSHSFTRDWSSDILLRRTDGVTAIWNMNGATVTSSNVTQWQASTDWSIAGIGDFNSDGRDDFLLRRTDGVTAIWSLDGTAVIDSDVTLWQAGNEWQVQGIGDFNADGFSDILWRRTSDGVTAIWNMDGAEVISADVTLWQASNDWTLVGVGDFNGDFNDDFLWRRESDGVLSIWNMDGTNVLSAGATSQQAGANWTVEGIGDFNNDNRDDILLRNSDGISAIWLMNGPTVTNASLTTVQAAHNWSFVSVGDYDGDGYDDLLLRNDDTGATAVWIMVGSFVYQTNVTSAQAGVEWGII